MFLNKLAANVPNNIPRNLPFCSFASFLIDLLTSQELAEAGAVTPNGNKTLSANSVSTSFINGKRALINGLKT